MAAGQLFDKRHNLLPENLITAEVIHFCFQLIPRCTYEICYKTALSSQCLFMYDRACAKAHYQIEKWKVESEELHSVVALLLFHCYIFFYHPGIMPILIIENNMDLSWVLGSFGKCSLNKVPLRQSLMTTRGWTRCMCPLWYLPSCRGRRERWQRPVTWPRAHMASSKVESSSTILRAFWFCSYFTCIPTASWEKPSQSAEGSEWV